MHEWLDIPTDISDEEIRFVPDTRRGGFYIEVGAGLHPSVPIAHITEARARILWHWLGYVLEMHDEPTAPDAWWEEAKP